MSAATLLAMAVGTAWGTTPVINEVMQSNINVEFDGREYPDSWVELYNPGPTDIDLKGYALGTSGKYKKAYVFGESLVVPAGGYKVIWCDKTTEAGHADIRLDSSGGSVVLFGPDGEVVASRDLEAMAAPNASCGLTERGNWEWLGEATPGRTNSAGAREVVVSEPLFSREGGMCREGFRLTVSLPDDAPAGSSLCVTLDCSEPTLGDSVTSPWTCDVSETTVVRAKVMAEGAVAPMSTTHSYIFHPSGWNLPVVSITGEWGDFYSAEKGILVEGDYPGGNYAQDWRRPVNVELFDGGETRINQLGETRVKGNSTRTAPQKSLVLYAHKRFGTPRYATKGLWDEKPEVESVKSFEIRNGGSCWSRGRLRDMYAQHLAGPSQDDLDWQGSVSAIAFINGVYYGVYDLQERSNDDLVEANYGTEDIYMFENWTESKGEDIDTEESLLGPLSNPGITLAQLEELVDVNSLLNYYALQIFAENTDCIWNNVVMWRPTEEGGRWRWILKDQDGFAPADRSPERSFFDIVRWFEFKDGEFQRRCVQPFWLFLRDRDAGELLIDRVALALGDYLKPETTARVFDKLYDAVVDEYPYHAERFGSESLYTDFVADMGYVKDWASRRPEYVYGHLNEEYSDLGGRYPLRIDHRGVALTGNDVALRTDRFDGQWFAGRPLRLRADGECTFTLKVSKVDGTEETSTATGREYVLNVGVAPESVELKVVNPLGVDETFAPAPVIRAGGGRIEVVEPVGPARVTVTDASGRTVYDGAKTLIDGLSPGLYIVAVIDGSGRRQATKIML